MRKVTPITEQFQHFVEDLQESFWGDLCGRTRLAWKKFFEAECYGSGTATVDCWHERSSDADRDYRNGFYERDYVTRFGTITRAPAGRTSCGKDPQEGFRSR